MNESYHEAALGGGLQGYGAGAQMVHVPTLKERLDMAVRQAEERLASAKRAREIFAKNPDLEELLNIMQRSNF